MFKNNVLFSRRSLFYFHCKLKLLNYEHHDMGKNKYLQVQEPTFTFNISWVARCVNTVLYSDSR